MYNTEIFKDKNILITGGAGFIGSHLSKKLISLGANLTVIDDFSRGTKDNLKEVFSKIKIVKADLRDEKKSQKYFKNQHIVFNLAALNTGVDYDLGRTEVMFEDNMLLQMMPLRMAKASNVKKFIQISSASVYSKEAMDNQVPTPETADISCPEPSKLGYALAKKMGENLAYWYSQNTCLETVCVRFINVYGENDNYDEKGHFIPVMIRKFIEADEQVNVFGSGNQMRSFMHVSDAVEALLIVAEKGISGEVYNVDSNNEKSIKDVVNLIEQSFKNKKLRIIFDKTKPEGSNRRILDSSKLKKLGWKPQVKFEEGLSLTINDIVSKFSK